MATYESDLVFLHQYFCTECNYPAPVQCHLGTLALGYDISVCKSQLIV